MESADGMLQLPKIASDNAASKGVNGVHRDCSSNVVVITGKGKDGPGIGDQILDCAANHDCEVLDLAQFLLEGFLVFTCVLVVSSDAFLREFLQVATRLGLKLDFYFPAENELTQEALQQKAVVAVATPNDITPALLRSVDKILCKHGCVVREIEHRSDNKFENNGEFTKISIRVDCPVGLKLSDVYIGEDLSSGLVTVAHDQHAVITLRGDDTMNRPEPKSLVIFELQHCLCPYDPLHELICEAGVDYAKVVESEGVGNKVGLLQGRSAQAERSLIGRLEFTPGARLLCNVLKAMGIRLAVLADAGGRRVVEHVRQELGMDYAFFHALEVEDGQFTGKFGGDLADIGLRKQDLMKLMADREGVPYRNVVFVGDPLAGLTASSAKFMFETFGPSILLNSAQMRDLTIVLYLLGFNGSHVRKLRNEYEIAQECESPKSKRDAWKGEPRRESRKGSKYVFGDEAYRALVHISTQTLEPGHTHRMFECLTLYQSDVQIASVRQCSLRTGGMCMGIDLRINPEKSQEVLKDLLYACQQMGLQVTLGHHGAQATWNTTSTFWRTYYKSRYVVTVVQSPVISTRSLALVWGTLASKGANCVRIERLATNFAAVQMYITLPADVNPEVLSVDLLKLSKTCDVYIAFQKDSVERYMRRLIVFDLSRTLLQPGTDIDDVIKKVGMHSERKAIKGEDENFVETEESFKSTVALLKGQHADTLFDMVKQSISFTEGAQHLCGTLKRLGFKIAVISESFLPIALEIQRQLGLDYAFANTLEVDDETGVLTGCTEGAIVSAERKRALLAMIAHIEGCTVSQTIAVGDGSSDLPMLKMAGLGIAFQSRTQAATKLEDAGDVRVSAPDLRTVLFLLGLSAPDLRTAIAQSTDCT